MIQANRKKAFKFIRIQFYLLFFAVMMAGAVSGWLMARSLLLGGLTCVLPTLYFAQKFFAKAGAQAAREIASSFYRAEAMKLLMTAGLFLIVFRYLDPIFLPFFIGFMVAQAAFWIGPFFLGPKVVES